MIVEGGRQRKTQLGKLHNFLFFKINVLCTQELEMNMSATSGGHSLGSMSLHC